MLVLHLYNLLVFYFSLCHSKGALILKHHVGPITFQTKMLLKQIDADCSINVHEYKIIATNVKFLT